MNADLPFEPNTNIQTVEVEVSAKESQFKSSVNRVPTRETDRRLS